MRRILLIGLGVVVLSSTSHAQIVIHDTSVTIRNAITAVLRGLEEAHPERSHQAPVATV